MSVVRWNRLEEHVHTIDLIHKLR